MKKIIGIVITVFSFLLTQSFASSLNINELKKVTEDSTEAKSGTGTCVTPDGH